MLSAYRKILAILTPGERRQFWALLAAAAASGIFEAVGVASIVPFLAVIADPGVIARNPVLAGLNAALGFTEPRAFLLFLGCAVFAVVVAGLMTKIALNSALHRFTSRRIYSLSTRLMRGYMAQPYAWFLQRHGADLGKSMLSEVDRVVDDVLIPAMRILAQCMVVLFLVGLLLLANPMVSITAALGLGAAYVVIFRIARRRIARLGADQVDANTGRYRVVNEAFGGIKDVKTLGLEETYLARFRQPAERVSRAEWFILTLMDAPRHALEAVAFGGMLLLVMVMLNAGEAGALAEILPLLGLYAFAGIRLFPATQQLFANFARLRFGLPALDAVHADFAVTAQGAEDIAAPSGPPLPLTRALELRGVRYGYEGTARAALRGLDLTVVANTTVGLVGGTGAGKTTAIDVMLGLLPPQEGALLVDGVAVTDANRRAWRRAIGYVPQQIFLVDDSIAANIAFGVAPETIDHDAVERAARLAEMHDFITTELPLGYATHVGERGVRLSGGQRQRIGIARALYRDPAMLIFDEATSALDTVTEQAVMDAVRTLGRAKTIVLVAHRLTTVRGCDVIHVLDQGVVAASGDYDALLRESPLFQRLAAQGPDAQKADAQEPGAG